MNNKSRGDDYLIDKIDKAISELVIDKHRLQKAYNYYNCKRDPEQFRYLEENYGIGSAVSIEFTPLIRKHVDALIGEYLGTPLLPKISCKDKSTISNITRDKQIAINKELMSFYKSKLNNTLLDFINGKDVVDHSVEDQINTLVEDINKNFVSEYEVAAQNVLEYIIQSKDTNLLDKLTVLLQDLIITGSCYYKIKKSSSGTNIEIDTRNTLNVFEDRNPESTKVNKGYRIVDRSWLSKPEILNRFGKDLTETQLEDVDGLFEGGAYSASYYVRSKSNVALPATNNAIGENVEVVPGYPYDSNSFNYQLVPVFDVEWIDTDKENGEYVLNRYSGTKIGESIYVLNGKDEDVVRSSDNPTYCTLKMNGIHYLSRNNVPYSLVLACAQLQDKYDLITYFRDNTIANSGVMGDWIDLPQLPTLLGSDFTERLQNYKALKKQGIAVIDTSQEGNVFNNNTTTSGFDDTIKTQTIQGFELVLDRIESTCSAITGVFRERLNGIQSTDAVSNVKIGQQNSFTITKQYYHQMDLVSSDLLLDSLNLAKVVWKKGLTGVLVLGDKLQKIFTALPEHFTMSDYDVHIASSNQIMQDIQQIQQLVMKFVESGQLDPDIIIEALTSRSMSELKSNVLKSVSRKQNYTKTIQDLQQKLEEAQSQLQQITNQFKQAQQKIDSLNESKIKIESDRLASETEINWFNAITERDYRQATTEIDTKKATYEIQQMADGNPFNDKIN